jgi:hypothetical protein
MRASQCRRAGERADIDVRLAVSLVRTVGWAQRTFAKGGKLLRALAEMNSYPVEITAEGLQDETSLAGHFEELAMYLGEAG